MSVASLRYTINHFKDKNKQPRLVGPYFQDNVYTFIYLCIIKCYNFRLWSQRQPVAWFLSAINILERGNSMKGESIHSGCDE